MTGLRVAILAGGISHERDISLRSGRKVADALISRGHVVHEIDPDASLFERLASVAPDVIWPALHGSSGEDGALLELLSAAGYALVGPSASAARLAWSKPTAKTLVSRQAISTPRSITVGRESFRELGAAKVLDLITSELGKNLVVKPASGGSAQGVSFVSSSEELPRAMVEAFTYGDLALVEQRIIGTEVAVAVSGVADQAVALPVVEIVPLAGVYSYEARYTAGETTFFVPARLSDEVSRETQRVAVVAHTTLGLSGLSRIDVMVDEAGTPWFFEANCLPGLTETSSAPLAIEASGVEVGAFYERLIQDALAATAS
jgi:D-alanine-D-alanine ligase